MQHSDLKRAALLIQEAEALIITAGAGMGVDSGLPDFRGPAGFWRAYPMYERLGRSFEQAANPIHFKRDPADGWGFYGHRTGLYRETIPHEGFHIIKRWIGQRPRFIVTSNVDGQFQRAGYAESDIYEVHGSIHHLQCEGPCCEEIWPNEEDISIDQETMRALRFPMCRHCQRAARPNILMFGDWAWLDKRARAQSRRYADFIKDAPAKRVVLEMGAGSAIPTIRFTTEDLAAMTGTRAIRINPREPEIDGRDNIALPMGALEALQAIDAQMS
ncbi:NAD-dependent deacetylase [Myxococcota bacterium]|nr:NAD-dependent deacetylase [Myxococcota bacterium]MBU1899471.1 NAD-dependent deacetylase [Myxococcota bacterium]